MAAAGSAEAGSESPAPSLNRPPPPIGRRGGRRRRPFVSTAAHQDDVRVRRPPIGRFNHHTPPNTWPSSERPLGRAGRPAPTLPLGGRRRLVHLRVNRDDPSSTRAVPG
ncbi:hypothetical protein chiPu_0024643, partial [Chiloscyllium punctatum]|nr:hypothetical protein [Chiloscyllium punctatum]